jgi:hypothetical protein
MATPTWGTQRGWRWCHKCGGLWFAGGNPLDPGRCPADQGPHSEAGSGRYSLVHNSPSDPGQHGWRWCHRCGGLWFAGNPSRGVCPVGGTHSVDGSGDYSPVFGAPGAAGQAGWRWCNRCTGLWFGGGASRGACPAGGTHADAGSGDYRLVQVTQKVRLHTKVLTAPTVPVETMMQQMRETYARQGIDVEWASTDTIVIPALNDLEVGQCIGAVGPFFGTTAEQDSLFTQRFPAGANDLVIYFVRSTVPPFNGCANFPGDKYGAVVTQGASPWTLAHEVGHVLGLSHCDDPPLIGSAPPRQFNRLMTGGGTSSITNPPPDLITTEGTALRDRSQTLGA